MSMALLFLLAAAAGGAVTWLALSRSGKTPSVDPAIAQELASLRRFRAAIDASGDSIYLVDRETMRFVDFTLTAERRTG